MKETKVLKKMHRVKTLVTYLYFAADVDRSKCLLATSSKALVTQATLVTWFITNLHTVTFSIGSKGENVVRILIIVCPSLVVTIRINNFLV